MACLNGFLVSAAFIGPFDSSEDLSLAAQNEFPKRKGIRLMDERTKLCVLAGLRAMKELKERDSLIPEEISLACATSPPGLGKKAFAEATAGVDQEEESLLPALSRNLPPLWMLTYLPNMAAAHTAIQLGARGPVQTCACTAGGMAQALTQAFIWLESGQARWSLAAFSDAGCLSACSMLFSSESAAALAEVCWTPASPVLGTGAPFSLPSVDDFKSGKPLSLAGGILEYRG